MKRIVATTLIILAIGSTSILYKEKAQASCQISPKKQDPANHPEAYSDGYRQGLESARKREKYRPRTAGGEFARGFKDGYDGRAYSVASPGFYDTIVYSTSTNECTNSIPVDLPTTSIPSIPKDIKLPKDFNLPSR